MIKRKLVWSATMLIFFENLTKQKNHLLRSRKAG